MLNVWVDEFTPCLKDNYSGALIETEVMRIRDKSFLSSMLHKYQILIDEKHAAKIMEVYHYEWSDIEF